MDYKKLSQTIVENVGGINNVIFLEHCSTRLRFSLADKSKANQKALKNTKGVIGIVSSAQFQIIIGNNVIEVYDEILKQFPEINLSSQSNNGNNKKLKFSEKAMEFIIGVFQPLVPAIAGAGVLKSTLLLFSLLGILNSETTIYATLAAISDATFYFLPIMVAVTTANVLKTNRLLAIATVGYLLLPSTITMLSEGLVIFGIEAKNIAYNSQIFPAILSVCLLGILEKGLNKISPKAIRVFFVPMVALAITIPVTLLFLGPLGYNIGSILTTVILFLYEKLGFVAVGLLAAILPLMIATGMHKALVPYAVNSLGELGYEGLYMPASLAHNISESGACFAVYLKAKDDVLKQTALSAGISALMGITEPALYGVTLQKKRVLLGISISSGLVGLFLGIMAVKAFVAVGPGLASMTMYIDENNGKNIIFAIIGFVLALFSSFFITLFTWKDENAINKEKQNTNLKNNIKIENKSLKMPLEVLASLEGESIPLEKTTDSVFSSKVLGDGVAIVPTNDIFLSPIDAEVVMLAETGHALILKYSENIDLLVHIGIDTVTMKGIGFKSFVKIGDKVKKGDKLVSFDLNEINKSGLDPTIFIILNNNSSKYKVFNQKYGKIITNDIIFEVKECE